MTDGGVELVTNLPEAWQVARLGDIAKSKGGFGFPIARQGQKNGEYPFFKVSDMNLLGNEKFMRASNNWIDSLTLKELKAKTFPRAAIIFPKIGAALLTNKKRMLVRDSVVDNNVMAVVVKEESQCLPEFLYQWFLTLDLGRIANPGTVPSLTSRRLEEVRLPLPPITEQGKIAAVLELVQRAIEQQERLLQLTAELKKTLLHQLFTQGLHGEPQKQTEIGLMPQSWEPTSLGTCCDILSGSLSYTDFLKIAPSNEDDAVECMAVKVSDMNLPGNESRFVTANQIKRLPVALARRKLLPPHTVVFPKRGAAIATNKKRLTTTWTVLDPNLIGVHAKSALDAEFLFHWQQTFDLRKITDPGPTPQLNKKDLIPILIPLPRDIDEQREIAQLVSRVDSKQSHHQQKKTTLTDLFHTLLHQLMTAQIRVNDIELSELSVERAA